MDKDQYKESHNQIIWALPGRPKKDIKRSSEVGLRQKETIISSEGHTESQRVKGSSERKVVGRTKGQITKSQRGKLSKSHWGKNGPKPMTLSESMYM